MPNGVFAIFYFVKNIILEGDKVVNQYLENVRTKAPLVHNITNYVTVNDVANIILACGGSPIMSDELEEVVEITSICSGLNINIGTLNKRTIEAMLAAGKQANKQRSVVVMDPVGAGASALRTNTAKQLMRELELDVIRGNMSEIKSLATGSRGGKGVDVGIVDIITEKTLDSAVSFAKKFAKQTDSIIVITGAIDLVADSKRCFVIRNGRPEMEKITGTGCQLSGLLTAFVAANQEHKLEAAATAVCTMGLAGEIGYLALQSGEGNMAYRNRIIDVIYNMDKETLEKGAKYELQ